MPDAYYIDWQSRTHWRVLPLPTQEESLAWPGVPIAEMPDGNLWEAVNWCAGNMLDLYAWAGRPIPRVDTRAKLTVELAAKFWLREQPVFGALVVAAVERGLAFAPATYEYLRRFVLRPGRQPGSIIGAPPWRNPNLLNDQARFRQAVNKDLEPKTNDSDDGGIDRFIDI